MTGFVGVAAALSAFASIVAGIPFVGTAEAQSTTQGPPVSVDATASEPPAPIPRVRVPPEYPRQALARAVTGWVVLQFTVNANGSVKDAVVLDSEPPGVFDDAARKAVKRWLYDPLPTERTGVSAKLTFALDSGPPPSVQAPPTPELITLQRLLSENPPPSPELIPLERFPPVYPTNALARRITGWVVVQFTVNSNGSVKDVVVVSSDPPGVFDDAARQAVARWRYDVLPTERTRVHTRVTFALDGRPSAAPRATQPQIFSRQLELCDDTLARRDRPPKARDLCKYLDDAANAARPPPPPPPPPPRQPLSIDAAVWAAIVVPFALAEDGHPIRQVLQRTLELDDGAAAVLASHAREALDDERNHWSALEQDLLCRKPESFATGEAFDRAVGAIHLERTAEQRRLSSELLAALDPAIAPRVASLGALIGAALQPPDGFVQYGSRQPLRDWTGQKLKTAKAVLCP